ncbi:hypothetical protein ILUMI_10844 [Ignelater luminosus]|uniref:Uncharacterized protein n=1 Tax=Ignelater luminosus TaxID=2038154 RepID=A0A8K0D682_IGNLU|nr:hypothetical protein ILUMI_10844 [Ignelater luminosus]
MRKTGTIDRKSCDDQLIRTRNRELEAKICKFIDKEPSVSFRDVPKKVGTNQRNVQEIKKRCGMTLVLYVKADFKSLSGNQYHLFRNVSNLDRSEKAGPVERFVKQFLVWQTICQCEMRSILFVSIGTINANTATIHT